MWWLGEARTRIDPATLALGATATAATSETRALQPNKSDLCHPRPAPPSSGSFVLLLRNTPTYVYLY